MVSRAPTLPWLRDRQPPMVQGLTLSPDLEVAQRYASAQGLVTPVDIARMIGATPDTITRWEQHRYFPPRRATLSAGERRRYSPKMRLYDRAEVRAWLMWALAAGEPRDVGRKVRVKEGAR